MYAVISKVSKGRKYYYLREQRRVKGTATPWQRLVCSLGRMCPDAVPQPIARAYAVLIGHESKCAYDAKWIDQQFMLNSRTIEGAVAWWKKIYAVRRLIESSDANWRKAVRVMMPGPNAVAVVITPAGIRLLSKAKPALDKLRWAIRTDRKKRIVVTTE